MKGNLIKIVTLVILIVLVVITFNLTNENQENKLNEENKGNQVSSVNSSKNDKEDNETIINDKKEEDIKSEVIEEGQNIIKQYKLYNNCVVTSENTQYKEVDYKYFIIRSYSEFEKYINEYLVDFNDADTQKYKDYNKNIIDNMLKDFDKDFFNENTVILLTDVNSIKQINGNISEISKDEAGIVDLKIKKEENDNLSNSITYVIPIEKGVKQVKAKHVN